MSPWSPRSWMHQVEARLPGASDPRVAVVFWALAAQVPVLALCALIVLFTGPATGFGIAVVLAILALGCMALIWTGHARLGAWVWIATNLALYITLSPSHGDSYSAMMTSIGVMVLLAAFALGWREALLISALGILAHAGFTASVLAGRPIAYPEPWEHLVGQGGVLVETALLAGLVSHRLHSALTRAMRSEQAAQQALAERDTELGLRRAADNKLTEALSSREAGQPGQERVPGEHEPRAADAAERHHRLQRAARGETRQRDTRYAGGPGAKIRTPASTCSSLINDILDLSKIEAGRMDRLCRADRPHRAPRGGPRDHRAAGRQERQHPGDRSSPRRTSARSTPTWDETQTEPAEPARQRFEVHQGRDDHAGA